MWPNDPDRDFSVTGTARALWLHCGRTVSTFLLPHDPLFVLFNVSRAKALDATLYRLSCLRLPPNVQSIVHDVHACFSGTTTSCVAACSPAAGCLLSACRVIHVILALQFARVSELRFRAIRLPHTA